MNLLGPVPAHRRLSPELARFTERTVIEIDNAQPLAQRLVPPPRAIGKTPSKGTIGRVLRVVDVDGGSHDPLHEMMREGRRQVRVLGQHRPGILPGTMILLAS